MINRIDQVRILLTGCLLLFCYTVTLGQRPKDGTYTYTVAFAEWNGKSLGATGTVVIKGDSIKVIHNGETNLTGNKGDILDQGIIMKHIKTGKWIIGHNPGDKDAKEIGGCSDGPSVIDFKGKNFWTCWREITSFHPETSYSLCCFAFKDVPSLESLSRNAGGELKKCLNLHDPGLVLSILRLPFPLCDFIHTTKSWNSNMNRSLGNNWNQLPSYLVLLTIGSIWCLPLKFLFPRDTPLRFCDLSYPAESTNKKLCV